LLFDCCCCCCCPGYCNKQHQQPGYDNPSRLHGLLFTTLAEISSL
jgi:hypothetical protein